jgi:hypothetical protein
LCTDLILWLGLLFDVCNFFSLHFVCSSDCYLKCLPCKSILTIFLRFEKSQPQLLFSLELIIFELTEISSMHFLMECHSLNLGTWDQLLFRVMRKTLRMLWGRWDFFWLTHSAVDEIQEIHFEPKKDNFNLLILKPNSKLSWSTLAEQPTTTCTKKMLRIVAISFSVGGCCSFVQGHWDWSPTSCSFYSFERSCCCESNEGNNIHSRN